MFTLRHPEDDRIKHVNKTTTNDINRQHKLTETVYFNRAPFIHRESYKRATLFWTIVLMFLGGFYTACGVELDSTEMSMLR